MEFKAGKIAVFVQIYCNNEPLKLSKNPRICLSCFVNMAPGTQTMLLSVLVLKIHSFKLQNWLPITQVDHKDTLKYNKR